MLEAEDDTLREFAEDSKTGRAAKTLVKEGRPLRITPVALKKGTVLLPHHVDGPISIQTIRGCLRLTTERKACDAALWLIKRIFIVRCRFSLSSKHSITCHGIRLVAKLSRHGAFI
jgi:hypothetical protein